MPELSSADAGACAGVGHDCALERPSLDESFLNSDIVAERETAKGPQVALQLRRHCCRDRPAEATAGFASASEDT